MTCIRIPIMGWLPLWVWISHVLILTQNQNKPQYEAKHWDLPANSWYSTLSHNRWKNNNLTLQAHRNFFYYTDLKLSAFWHGYRISPCFIKRKQSRYQAMYKTGLGWPTPPQPTLLILYQNMSKLIEWCLTQVLLSTLTFSALLLLKL